MTIQLEIPEEFVSHFYKDRFEDSLGRLSADAHMIAGNYEIETATMLTEAFKKCKVIEKAEESIQNVQSEHELQTEKVKVAFYYVDSDLFGDEDESVYHEFPDVESAISAYHEIPNHFEKELGMESTEEQPSRMALVQCKNGIDTLYDIEAASLSGKWVTPETMEAQKKVREFLATHEVEIAYHFKKKNQYLQYLTIQSVSDGYDYTFYDGSFNEIDGGVYDNPDISVEEALEEILLGAGISSWPTHRKAVDYAALMEKVQSVNHMDHHREEVEIVYRYEVMNGIYENDRMTRFYDAGNCPVQKPWYKENDPSVMGRPEGERHIPISEATISARAAKILQKTSRQQLDEQWQSYTGQRKRSFDNWTAIYVNALENEAREYMLRSGSPWGSWLGRISDPQKPGNYIDLDITGYSTMNTVSLTAQIVQNNAVRDEVVISQLPYDNFINGPTCFADKINDIDKIMEYPNLNFYNPDGIKGSYSLREHYQLLRQNGFESEMPDRTMYEQRIMIKEQKEYTLVELFGTPVLFDDGRIADEDIPKGMYRYEMRGFDDDPAVPSTVENGNVRVNLAATILTVYPLPIPKDTEFLQLGDELDFGSGETMSIHDYRQFTDKLSSLEMKQKMESAIILANGRYLDKEVVEDEEDEQEQLVSFHRRGR